MSNPKIEAIRDVNAIASTAYQEGRRDAFALVAQSIRTELDRSVSRSLNPASRAVLENLEGLLREGRWCTRQMRACREVWQIVYPENQHENERS